MCWRAKEKTGGDHTGYGQGSACLDVAVDQYLIDGALRKANLLCNF